MVPEVMFRRPLVDADRIRISPKLPVLTKGAPPGQGQYRWPDGSLLYAMGDGITCPKCGHGNRTNASQCLHCRSLLLLGKSHPEKVA